MKKIFIDIVVGLAVTALGIFVTQAFWEATAPKAQVVGGELTNVTSNGTAKVDPEKCLQFENHLVDLFTALDWSILKQGQDADNNWRGLLVEGENEVSVFRIIIESIWVESVPADGLYWATEGELKNIMNAVENEDKLDKDIKRPNVFLLVGLGGKPENPSEVCIVPIRKIEEGRLSLKDLESRKSSGNISKGQFEYDGNLLKLH